MVPLADCLNHENVNVSHDFSNPIKKEEISNDDENSSGCNTDNDSAYGSDRELKKISKPEKVEESSKFFEEMEANFKKEDQEFDFVMYTKSQSYVMLLNK